jgi:hypothetical protein
LLFLAGDGLQTFNQPQEFACLASLQLAGLQGDKKELAALELVGFEESLHECRLLVTADLVIIRPFPIEDHVLTSRDAGEAGS